MVLVSRQLLTLFRHRKQRRHNANFAFLQVLQQRIRRRKDPDSASKGQAFQVSYLSQEAVHRPGTFNPLYASSQTDNWQGAQLASQPKQHWNRNLRDGGHPRSRSQRPRKAALWLVEAHPEFAREQSDFQSIFFRRRWWWRRRSDGEKA